VNANISVVTISGNHDIGYGNEADAWSIGRFEDEFGRSERTVPIAGHDLVLVSSCVLDGARSAHHRRAAWAHARSAGAAARAAARPVLLATHIPLHKETGRCVDPPYTRLTQCARRERRRWLRRGLTWRAVTAT
jgi:hypothetical protein